MQQKTRASAAFVLLILLVAGILLVWNGRSRYQEYLDHQQELGQRIVKAAASEIGLQLAELQRRVAIFADQESGLIREVGAHPEENGSSTRLADKVEAYFPDRFAFTIATATGDTLVDDLEGLVGEICRRDIRAFDGDRHPYRPYLHPQPEAYHFDVMANWEAPDGERGVFFVSFHPTVIARILANSELAGHQLLVLLASDLPLIEVTSNGARNTLRRGLRLTAAELARLGSSQPIPDTRWVLADLPVTRVNDRKRDAVVRETALVIVVLALITFVMLRFLWQSERRRHAAEEGLRRSHHELELRIRDRTQRLTQANAELQAAMKERKRAVRELREREATLGAIMDTAVDGIVVINGQAEILTFNRAAEHMFGYSAQEIVGQNVKVLMPAPYQDEHDGYLARYYETGERRIIGIGRRVAGQRKDGSVFPMDLAVSEVNVGGNRLFAGIIRQVPADQG